MCGLLLLANLTPDLMLVMEWLDYGTLGLLFGMMVIVGILQRTGVFEVMCTVCLKACKGRMWLLTVYLCCLTGFLSAWLDNVTTMLLMGPMAISVFATLNRDPVPLLISMAIMSNVGGTATMISDPPNIIIGNVLRQEIGFIDFLIHLAPGVLIAFPFGLAGLLWFYKKELAGNLENMDAILDKCKDYKIKNYKLLAISGYVTVGVIIGFLLHPIHHLNPAWIAIISATFLGALASPEDVHDIIRSVEWDMLLFFAELGLIRKIAGLLTMIIESSEPEQYNIISVQVIIWFSAIFSAILDNIPYTITMLPVIKELAVNFPGLDLQTMAWALSFGACFGGNGSLIGASANIVTSGIAAKAGFNISFNAWLKPGILVTVITVAVADIYMILRYCL
eukprot:gene21621-28624_t